MSDADGDGTWEVTVPLAAGSYQYKFVGDGNWFADPNAAATADDGFGGQNSLVEVKGDGTVGGGGAAGGAGMSIAPGAGAAPAADAIEVTFRFQPVISGIQSCHLVGEFNEWSAESHPMRRRKDGAWAATVRLEKGTEHQYRFLIDGDGWASDPDADRLVDNPYGGENSVVAV